MATLYAPSKENIRFLSRQLLEGKLVAVPTETVYGLAGNALDPIACARIFEVKERPSFDPLIIHISQSDELPKLAVANPAVEQLTEKFWPGPLTLVLPKTNAVPDIVTAGLPSVAIRVPAHPVFQTLLQDCRLPLAAPSANPFSYVSPTTPEHVEESLGQKIEFILDGGPCLLGIESTIVDLRDPQSPILLRPGSLPAEEIERVLNQKLKIGSSPSPGETMPGQLDRHYSPRAKVRLFDPGTLELSFPPDQIAKIFYQQPSSTTQPYTANVFFLSDNGDAVEAASRLFATLREVDSRGYKEVQIELAPPSGLGHAINDRLRRAAGKMTSP